MLSTNGWTGSVLELVFHAAGKITLFFCAGAITVRTGIENVSELDGIGRKMPLTLGAFAVGALGLSSLPPLAGFLSKWYLCIGALQAEEMLFLVVLLASSVLNAAYFFPIVFRAFFRKPEPGAGVDGLPAGEASLFMVVPLCISAAFSIALFLAPNVPLHFLEIAKTVVRQVLQGG